MPLDPNDAPEGYEAVEQIAKSPCEVCAFGHAVADGLCEYPCVPGERRDGANVIFVKRQAPQEAADAEIPNTFKLPGETDDQWIDRITGAQAAPAAVAEPSTPIHWPLNEDQARMAFWGSYPDTGDSTKSEVWMTAYRWCRALAAAPAAAQPVAGEPVARVVRDAAAVRLEWAGVREAHNAKPGPLYTTPPALVGLSDAQIAELNRAAQDQAISSGIPPSVYLARAVERALAAANGMELREPRDN